MDEYKRLTLLVLHGQTVNLAATEQSVVQQKLQKADGDKAGRESSLS